MALLENTVYEVLPALVWIPCPDCGECAGEKDGEKPAFFWIHGGFMWSDNPPRVVVCGLCGYREDKKIS